MEYNEMSIIHAMDRAADRLEVLREKWAELIGPYMHTDPGGIEWFDPMPPEVEQFDRIVSNEIEDLELELASLEAELRGEVIA